jgi:dCMP deaminase
MSPIPSERTHKWDLRFLREAALASTCSKDPSTQCGAKIVDPDNRVVSSGFNGFPRGVEDSPDRLINREFKLRGIIHAELNAILFAQRPLHGHTIYTWPLPPCGLCAAVIVQVGIRRVVVPGNVPKDKLERWALDFQVAEKWFLEGQVEVTVLDAVIDPAWLVPDACCA